MTSTLSYSLGADDISKIVDAILPPLSPFLSNLTKNQQYLVIHRAVLDRSKDKLYSNAYELDLIVKSIVNDISSIVILNYNDNANGEIMATPDNSCTGLSENNCTTVVGSCFWTVNNTCIYINL